MSRIYRLAAVVVPAAVIGLRPCRLAAVAGPVVLAELVAPVELVDLVALAVVTVPPLSQPAVPATDGSTIHSIAVAPHIETGRLRIGLAVWRAENPLPTARRARGSKLDGRVAIWLAIAAEEPA